MTNCDCSNGPDSVVVTIGPTPGLCECDAAKLVAAIENMYERLRADCEARAAVVEAERRTRDAEQDVARQLARSVGLGRWVVWGDIMYCVVRSADKLILKTLAVE